MASIAIFAISGVAIVTLIAAKMLEEKRSTKLFISRWIMRSDEQFKDWYHRMLYIYSAGKDRISFFMTKEIRLHSKNTFNKFLAYLKEKRGQYETNMRNSRLLKKQDGISEFFKSISDVEKGNGEINEPFEEGENKVK